MKTVSMRIVQNDFSCGRRQHLAQDEYLVSGEAQYTSLRSCVCVGFYHALRKIGAISHYTGFHLHGPKSISRLLDNLEAGFAEYGISLDECECFVVGGSDKSPRPLQLALRALEMRSMPHRVLDQLGSWQRKLAFEPATGTLVLLKKNPEQESRGYFAVGESLDGFTDVTRRVATGATTFFRNAGLLDCLTDTVLPQSAEQSNRFHVWCAGCSNGMEVYSIAMVVLDWMTRHRMSLGFKILGSDISQEALDTAAAGCYPIGKRPPEQHKYLFDKYMQPADSGMIVATPELRSVTVFKQRDIAHGSRRHRFELVICDHVLQYFTAARQLEYVASLVRACQPGGFLYVSTPLHRVSEAIVHHYQMEKLGRHFYRLPE